MKSFVGLLAAVSLTNGLIIEQVEWNKEFTNFRELDQKKIFDAWKVAFDKTYENIEKESAAYLTFYDNLYKICEWNENANEPKSVKLRLNQFGDLSGDDFRLAVHGHTGSCLNKDIKKWEQAKTIDPTLLGVDVPDSVDWRQQGVVTPVKNQGQCGSCWAFSTTGSIECETAISTGKLVSLSEQQLVDCSRSYGNDGCNGGLMDNAFKYVEATGGLCSESEYPYKGTDGTCKASSCSTLYDPIKSYVDVKHDDESALESAVALGCVSVAIEADQFAFQFYSSGILDGSCGTSLDHGVLVVGYGTESGQDYWWVKNSWGESWGEEGYVQICRNCNKNGNKGECGILQEPSYPTV